MQAETVRPYTKEDRQAVRAIAWQTAFMGGPASVFFDDEELLADLLTSYFTDHEPQSCFVVEDSGEVAGYITGSTYVRRLNMVFFFEILPRLALKAFFRAALLNKKNFAFLLALAKSFLNGEFAAPDLSREYPATLHINLKEGARRKGLGSKLMHAYLGYLFDKKVAGVHMATMSEKGASFFKKEGFGVLHVQERTYLKHITGGNTRVYIFGKKITL
ncbi:MAG TPA: hypothetical protein DCL35_06840 [Candidatus Omnitrophica bacterium]|nr:hypothetical protein [Candidatus Omnitrophota bacterium]